MRRLSLSAQAPFLLLLAAPAARAALVCPSPPQTIDPTQRTSIAGDTTGKPATAQTYACVDSAFGPPGARGGYSGPEDVYEFTLTAPLSVGFQLLATNPDMHLLLLRDCDEASCLYEGGCGEELAPGTYRLVVDGLNGAEGRYLITPYLFEGGWNRWTDCPECVDGTCEQAPEAIGLKKWGFNSFNYCGTGCDFAMYAAVGCGSELHVPFFDAETGHMKVHDLFRDRFLNLVAQTDGVGSCAFASSGTLVQWEDGGCTAIPCPAGSCGGGSDCRTNNRRLDVELLGSPLLCGVLRLTFHNWGGWVWQAFANCTGDATEQFDIYRDACSAIANWRPRAELGIVRLLYDEAQCSANRLTGEITVENVGCLDAPGELVIEEVGVGNPQLVPFAAPAGQSVAVPWTYDFLVAPASLRFTLDPANRVAECSEDLGRGVHCGRSTMLERTRDVTQACGSRGRSQAHSGAEGDPLAACAGDTVVLDATGSRFRCSSASVQEYRWEREDGVPSCDWGSSPRCGVAASALLLGKNRFTLRTRCADDPSGSVSSDGAAVVRLENVAPPDAGNVLRLRRAGSDVVAAWTGTAGGQVPTWRLYQAADAQATARTAVAEARSTAQELRHAGAVGAAPALSFYRLVGVSCAGDLEGGE